MFKKDNLLILTVIPINIADVICNKLNKQSGLS